MCGKTKHDQVSISAINAVARIGVEVGLGALRSNEVKNFMLSFTWHKGIGEYDCNSFPKIVRVASL